MESGEWRVESGEWRVERGERMERKAGEREGARNQKTSKLRKEAETETETERR